MRRDMYRELGAILKNFKQLRLAGASPCFTYELRDDFFKFLEKCPEQDRLSFLIAIPNELLKYVLIWNKRSESDDIPREVISTWQPLCNRLTDVLSLLTYADQAVRFLFFLNKTPEFREILATAFSHGFTFFTKSSAQNNIIYDTFDPIKKFALAHDLESIPKQQQMRSIIYTTLFELSSNKCNDIFSKVGEGSVREILLGCTTEKLSDFNPHLQALLSMLHKKQQAGLYELILQHLQETDDIQDYFLKFSKILLAKGHITIIKDLIIELRTDAMIKVVPNRGALHHLLMQWGEAAQAYNQFNGCSQKIYSALVLTLGGHIHTLFEDKRDLNRFLNILLRENVIDDQDEYVPFFEKKEMITDQDRLRVKTFRWALGDTRLNTQKPIPFTKKDTPFVQIDARTRYKKLCQPVQSKEKQVRAILGNYVGSFMGNSRFAGVGLFLTGHWRRTRAYRYAVSQALNDTLLTADISVLIGCIIENLTRENPQIIATLFKLESSFFRRLVYIAHDIMGQSLEEVCRPCELSPDPTDLYQLPGR